MNQKVVLTLIATLLFVSCNQNRNEAFDLSSENILAYWHAGRTLPVEMTRKFPWPSLEIENDNGINVLVDLAHQCTFATMWDMPGNLKRLGFRAVGSMASLNTVLERGGQSRIRAFYDDENRIYPFAWWDNPEFNVVITEQNDPNAQEYTEAEINALAEFVSNGGGLVIMATPQRAEIMNRWSINTLAQRFGLRFSHETDTHFGTRFAIIEGDNQQYLLKGDNGNVIAAMVQYGNGHVAVLGHHTAFRFHRQRDTEERVYRVRNFIASTLTKVSQGKAPVNCDARFPITMGGGGAIFPELEQKFGEIVLYYAANQRIDLLNCVREDVPYAMERIQRWLPSRPSEEPMHLILAAGGGGGWAVNAFRPRENGIISLDCFGILSIFAHELAHTMAGPRNDRGEIAGRPPLSNLGEAHAGWFQGKIDAVFDPERKNRANRNANRIFDLEGVLTEMDLTIYYENAAAGQRWGHGTYWYKVWYIWQKLDDRYGTTWYPRWRWVQSTRWADTPDRVLTWDEMIEDKSIAVGEDLFPFFRKLGTTLEQERLEQIEFQGTMMTLPVAPIELTPAGNVRLCEIGDYREAIVVE